MKVFASSDSQGRVWIQVKLAGQAAFLWFKMVHLSESNIQAEYSTIFGNLVRDALQEELERKICHERMRAYNLGWEDKTKRRKKRMEFSSCFNSEGGSDSIW